MTCADDMVLVNENRSMLEGKHERWQEVLKENRLKINKVKTEFLDFGFKNKVGEFYKNHNIRLKVN